MDVEYKDGTSPRSTLSSLPIELLICVISLLTTRDKAKIRNVSQRLRSVVDETPSLWKEFMWPCYHNGDEGCVNNVLKVCGEYVQHLSFSHRHVTPSKLVKMLEYCSNVIELNLPTTKLDPEQLGKVVKLMTGLQKLDTKWDDDIKLLLELVNVDLKELTIRLQQQHHSDSCSMDSWVNVWIFREFLPEKINIICTDTSYSRISAYIHKGLNCWVSSNFKSPPGHFGQIKLYRSVRLPLNLYPVLPVFQLDFGQSATPPLATMKDFGSGVFLLTDGIEHHGEMVCRANMLVNERHAFLYPYAVNYKCPSMYASTQPNCSNIGFNFVTEFVCQSARLCGEVLEQIAFILPNLQRLSVRFSEYECNLKGLRAIASSCHYLQGLKIWDISQEDDQTQLWEILSDMKLTHLAVKLCVLLPSAENVHKLTILFQKFTKLQALEAGCKGLDDCIECKSKFVNNTMMVLSHFPSLTHCIIYTIPCLWTQSTTIHDILTSCKQLKCLILKDGNQQVTKSLPSACCSNLQQLYYTTAQVSDTFLTEVSAHGGLVHVVLCASFATTSEGIFSLVRNSPNLMTLRVVLSNGCNVIVANPKMVQLRLQQEFAHRPLFLMGRCTITIDIFSYEIENLEWEERYNTDLYSLWEDIYDKHYTVY